MDQKDFLELQACWEILAAQGFRDLAVIRDYQVSLGWMEMKALRVKPALQDLPVKRDSRVMYMVQNQEPWDNQACLENWERKGLQEILAIQDLKVLTVAQGFRVRKVKGEIRAIPVPQAHQELPAPVDLMSV